MNREDITLSQEEVALVITSLEKIKEEQNQKIDRTIAKIARFTIQNDRYTGEDDIKFANLIKAVEGNAENEIENNDTVATGINTNLLTKDASFTDKIYMILKNKLKRASRYPEIQKAFDESNELTDNKRDIRKGLYDLRDSNQIVSIRFNDSINHVYYGLPDWVIETNQGYEFKKPFAPDPSQLQNGIWKGEDFKNIKGR